MNIRNKVAFLIHTDEMYIHYRNVWQYLESNSFDVILHGESEARDQCKLKANEYGVNYYDSEFILMNEIKYKTLVSNHSIFSYNGSSLIKQLGVTQVRFMYALGKYKHNFSYWNRDYDLALCFGPWQEEKLSSMFDLATFQMGYPRYDDYFSKPELIGYCPEELGLDPNKKTILWLPTWLELSSVPSFADAMESLMDRYNVIVKLHPLSASAEPEKIKLLEGFNFTKIITDVYDNLILFRCSDFVFCDYGGTAFGALYLDKPLVLLNVKGAMDDELVGEDSPDILLRNSVINYEYNERWRIKSDLENASLWEEQMTVRKELRKRYFSSSYGFSAQLAALAIMNVDNILKQG